MKSPGVLILFKIQKIKFFLSEREINTHKTLTEIGNKDPDAGAHKHEERLEGGREGMPGWSRWRRPRRREPVKDPDTASEETGCVALKNREPL